MLKDRLIPRRTLGEEVFIKVMTSPL